MTRENAASKAHRNLSEGRLTIIEMQRDPAVSGGGTLAGSRRFERASEVPPSGEIMPLDLIAVNRANQLSAAIRTDHGLGTAAACSHLLATRLAWWVLANVGALVAGMHWLSGGDRLRVAEFVDTACPGPAWAARELAKILVAGLGLLRQDPDDPFAIVLLHIVEGVGRAMLAVLE